MEADAQSVREGTYLDYLDYLDSSWHTSKHHLPSRFTTAAAGCLQTSGLANAGTALQ